MVGLGMGCVFPVATTAVQNAVPRETMGTATAAGIMMRQTGGALGVAAFGALFTHRFMTGLGDSAASIGDISQIGPQTLAGLPPDLQAQLATSVISAIAPIYWIAAGLALVGFVFALMLKEIPLTNRQVPKGE
jgi:hypothetical protein